MKIQFFGLYNKKCIIIMLFNSNLESVVTGLSTLFIRC